MGVTVPAACAAAAEWQELQPRLTKSAAPEEPEPVAVVVGGDEPPAAGVVPPVAGVAVFPGVAADKVTPMPIRPFIPLAACPGVWERNSNVPFFENLTVSDADWPGLRVFVLSPKQELAVVVPVGSVQIKNWCGSFPRFSDLEGDRRGKQRGFRECELVLARFARRDGHDGPFGLPTAATASYPSAAQTRQATAT